MTHLNAPLYLAKPDGVQKKKLIHERLFIYLINNLKKERGN